MNCRTRPTNEIVGATQWTLLKNRFTSHPKPLSHEEGGAKMAHKQS